MFQLFYNVGVQTGRLHFLFGSKEDDSARGKQSVPDPVYDTVFSTEEVEVYMRLLEEPKSEQTRLRMLNQRRDAALDELHLRERLLQRLDYLRHEIQNQK